MSESVVSTTRPVSDFTGHCPVNPETLKKEFEELNSAAHEQATLVPVACAALGTALDELMPILAKMQSLLSQRGENRDLFRDAEIPTWSEWWKSYKKETGLRSCLRTVQRKLKEHRSLGKPVEESSKRPVPPLHLSSRDQRRVLKALQYANEMADALNHDHEYRGFLREYNRVALDSDNIEQMLENIPVEAEFGVISRGHTAPASAAPALAEVPEAPPRGHPQPSPLRMPNSDEHSALFDVVNDRCGGEIRACLTGLEPDLMATVIGAFVSKLTNMHCHYDREAGEITVKVEYCRAEPLALDAAA